MLYSAIILGKKNQNPKDETASPISLVEWDVSVLQLRKLLSHKQKE